MKQLRSRLLPQPNQAAVFILTLLMLLQFLPVQAAARQSPSAETVNYVLTISAEMKAYREGAPVCPGDKVTFIVRAWRAGTSRDSHLDIPKTPAFGVPIEVLPPSGGVIQLSSSSKAMTSLDLDLPGAVEFTFTTKKPGKAEIIFEAMFPEKQVDVETRGSLSRAELNEILYADVKTTVEVAECPLQITAINHYITDYDGLYQKITSTLKRVPLMQVDVEGKLFVYEGAEKLVIREKVPGCKVSWKTTERYVRVEALKTEENYHITIERGPMTVSVTHTCPDGENTTSINIPDGGKQEIDMPIKGGTKKEKMIIPPTTNFYWNLILKVNQK